MAAKEAFAHWSKQGKKVTLAKCFGVAALVIALVTFGCNGGGEKTDPGKQEPKTVGQETTAPQKNAIPPALVKPLSAPAIKEEQPVKPANISLGVTINEFCLRFNKNSEQVKSKLRIKKLQIGAGGAQNTFRYNFNENLYLAGKLNKADGSVEEITLAGVLNGSLATTVDLNMSIGMIITALNPELSQERRNTVLNALGINNDQADIYNLDKKVTRNGITYLTKSSFEKGRSPIQRKECQR